MFSQSGGGPAADLYHSHHGGDLLQKRGRASAATGKFGFYRGCFQQDASEVRKLVTLVRAASRKCERCTVTVQKIRSVD